MTTELGDGQVSVTKGGTAPAPASGDTNEGWKYHGP